MRAFLYARVSTGEQNEGMQLREMQEHATARNWEQEVFPDVAQSGGKEHRPALDRMMDLVRRRKCDIVLVYKFDRFARSLRHLLNALEEFDALGIAFVSLHDNIDTTTPTGRLMFQIIGAFAEFERSMIRARVKSGMEHARARGKRIGRPAIVIDAAQVAHLRSRKHSLRAIATEVGVSEATVRRLLKSTARPRQKGVKK